MADPYDLILSSFSNLTKKPEAFSCANEDLLSQAKQCMKDTYDISSPDETLTSNRVILPELMIEHFDLEQIWQQIELKNEFFINHSLFDISKLLVSKNNFIFKNLLKSDDVISEEDASDARPQHMELESPQNDTETIEGQKLNIVVKKKALSENSRKTKGDFLENSGDTTDEEMEESRTYELSEKSLHIRDVQNNGQTTGEEQEILEEGILTEKLQSDEESNDELEMLENEALGETTDEEQEILEEGILTENLQSDEESNDELEMLENEALGEKPWQMKGEVSQNDRAEYSLLEHALEVDIRRKPPVVVTEKVTLKLEEIIKRRIKDKTFDSVKRKTKLLETPLEYKKKLTLDQEKSKQSLAEVYEKEYLNQEQKLAGESKNSQEMPQLHKEIKTMMTQLFSKLDSLTNYHFTPRPAHAGIKVVNNLPTVAIEEVIPVGASNTTLLAPEEIAVKPKGDIKGKSERTATDRKREKRKKKSKNKNLQKSELFTNKKK